MIVSSDERSTIKCPKCEESVSPHILNPSKYKLCKCFFCKHFFLVRHEIGIGWVYKKYIPAAERLRRLTLRRQKARQKKYRSRDD